MLVDVCFPERCIGLRTILSSKAVMMILARVGPSEDPIATPSVCLKSWPFMEKGVWVQQPCSSFFRLLFFNEVLIRFLL